jgi:hypothetical protein
MDRGVAHAGARVPKMGRRCFWISMSPEFATSLHSQNSSEGDAVLWPVLPIVIRVHEMWDVDNVIAALEHNDRIYKLELLSIPSLQFEKVLAATQQPFPALSYLELGLKDGTARSLSALSAPVIPVPASFLGGSAPQLQTFFLDRILFPGLNYFYLPLTLSIFIFRELLILGTFHPRPWSLASQRIFRGPRRPDQ